MTRVINWFGLAAGITTLVMLAVSMFMPWWQLVIGENLLTVNASPIYTDIGWLGAQFTIPLLWAINIAIILTFAAGGVIMLLYSLIPTKPYAKELLGFSWRKPLYALVFFIVGIIAVIAIAGMFHLSIPLVGSADFVLPTDLITSGSISVTLTAGFMLPFYLAIATAVLCVAARIYHGRINKQMQTQTVANTQVPPPPQPINPA